MQVLLVSFGSHGDVVPFLALGTALKARGHEVVLATAPHYADMVAEAGIGFEAFGTTDDFDRFFTRTLWNPWLGGQHALREMVPATEAMVRWLEATWVPSKGVVIANVFNIAVRTAQDRLGFPLVTVHIMPVTTESAFDSPHFPGAPLLNRLPSRVRHRLWRYSDTVILDPAIRPSLNAVRAILGLRPVKRVRHWWNSPDRVLMAWPDWYAAAQPDWPAQAVQTGFLLPDRRAEARKLDDDLEEFLRAGSEPLLFTFGSQMDATGPLFEAAIGICTKLRRRAVFVLGGKGTLPHRALPDGIFPTAYAPFDLLLPRCAAVIHHGGIGTIAEAIAAGIPQLVLPVAFNHFDDGRRVQALGIGRVCRWPIFRVARASRHLRHLLSSPAVAEACVTTRARMAADSATIRACESVEALLQEQLLVA